MKNSDTGFMKRFFSIVWVFVIVSSEIFISHKVWADDIYTHEPPIPVVLSSWRKTLNCAHSIYEPEKLPSTAQRIFHLSQLHRITRGENQIIAILSTGVSPNPRLTQLKGIDDLVGTSNGLEDCDGIGTAVAGIIAGQSAVGDDFMGVAPNSEILSLRTTSRAYMPTQQGLNLTQIVQNNLNMLTRGIAEASRHGATIIVIPQSLCYAASLPVDISLLRHMIDYAILRKNIMIIAAVGDNGDGACGAENPGHSRILTAPVIASQRILNVSSLSISGIPSDFSRPSNYPLVAAVGEGVVSLSNDKSLRNLANGFPEEDNSINFFNSTAFSAAYVAGLAALIRSLHPSLRVSEVMYRIISTAHPFSQYPSDRVGSGSIDPMAALTWEVPGSAPPNPPQEKLSFVLPQAPKSIVPEVIIVVAGISTMVLIFILLIYYSTFRVASRKFLGSDDASPRGKG